MEKKVERQQDKVEELEDQQGRRSWRSEGCSDEAAGSRGWLRPGSPSVLLAAERGIKVTQCNHCLLSANEEEEREDGSQGRD